MYHIILADPWVDPIWIPKSEDNPINCDSAPDIQYPDTAISKRKETMRLMHELRNAIKDLCDIYYKMPPSNVSTCKISDLRVIIDVQLFTLTRGLLGKEISKLKRGWLIDEIRARFILKELKIEVINSLRICKSFTPAEKEAIPGHIETIKTTWAQLKAYNQYDSEMVEKIVVDKETAECKFRSMIRGAWM